MKKEIFNLKGKNILFTGAGTWLGKSMSAALADYGANMALTSRSEEKAKDVAKKYSETFAGRFIGKQLNILDSDAVAELIEATEKELGSIDVVVNNAAATVPDLLHQSSRSSWESAMDGSINAVFQIVRETIPHMQKRRKGNIINIASMYGIVAPDYQIYEDTDISCNPPGYGAGKAAIIQFTKYIAAYYGKEGIRANCISPGAFPQQNVQTHSQFIANLKRKVPLGRIGKPDDLQGAVVLLASDASSYITGQNFVVDGGWTIT